MKCIMGIVQPDAGEIVLEIDGRRIDLVGRRPEEIVRLGVTLVPEGRRLLPRLTVKETLVLGAYRPRRRATSRAISISASRPSPCWPVGRSSSPGA